MRLRCRVGWQRCRSGVAAIGFAGGCDVDRASRDVDRVWLSSGVVVMVSSDEDRVQRSFDACSFESLTRHRGEPAECGEIY